MPFWHLGVPKPAAFAVNSVIPSFLFVTRFCLHRVGVQYEKAANTATWQLLIIKHCL